MVRTSRGLLAGILLVGFGAALAAEEAPAGTYKLTIAMRNRDGDKVPRTLWLVRLESKDGKWTGKLVSAAAEQLEGTLTNLTVTDGRLQFVLKLGDNEYSFDGKMPAKDATRILGSFALGNEIVPAELEATKLTSLDSYEVNKDLVARSSGGAEFFDAVVELLQSASEKKAKPAEVRAWAAKAFKAAEPYGSRWQRDIGLRITEALASQEAFAPVAIEYARQTARLVEASDAPSVQLRVLETLAQLLRKAGKTEEARDAEAQVAKLIARDYQEYIKKMLPFQPDKFDGRKAPNDRAVLVELFTGAQCPPCVAADLGFDVLNQTYKPTDVVLLQYHLHIPRPDPLTNPDAEARQQFYGDEIEGTPTILFNGKSGAPGGGGSDAAQEKYREYRKVIEPLLEKPSSIKVKAVAVRKGDKIDITAQASGLEKPGEKMRLRLALVEEQVRYTGGNGLRYHHHVVRALPGGADGLALKEKTGKQTATVDLPELREKWNRYLTGVARKRPFANASRPMEFRNLAVVAFVQDDATKEVLQAVQVPVTAEK